MSIDEEILVNQLAQGIVPIESGRTWFRSLETGAVDDNTLSKRSVLRGLACFIKNAHPIPTDALDAIQASGLKPTFTPCVLLRSGEDTATQLAKITGLPEPELEKAFTLMIALLEVARRSPIAEPMLATRPDKSLVASRP